VTIDNPNSSFAYTFTLYFPASADPELGPLYAERTDKPILTSTTLIAGQSQLAYLPVVMR